MRSRVGTPQQLKCCGVLGILFFLVGFGGRLDLLQKSKTHPPQSPREFGGKQEKLGSLPEVAGRVGEGSQDFCKRSIVSLQPLGKNGPTNPAVRV